MIKIKAYQRVVFGLGVLSCLAGSAAEMAPVALGLQGGMNFSNASSTSQLSSSTRPGFMGGVSVNFSLGETLAIQPELLYVQRGAKVVDSFGVNLTTTSDSLEVPVLVKAYLGTGVRPYVFAGPVAILNVANRIEADVEGKSGTLSYNPRTLDLAADVGAGLEVGPIFGTIRYSLGLLSENEGHGDWKTRGIQLQIGIYL